RSAAHQDVAEPQILFGERLDEFDVVADAAARGKDADLAALAHEVEDRLDGLFVGAALEGDLKTEITALRVHVGGGGQAVVERLDADDLAQGGQIAQERQRIHTVAQRLRTEPQRDMPVVPGYLSGHALHD